MKFSKWLKVTAAALALSASLTLAPKANAEVKNSIADESIYDLLVDRFFNGSGWNDTDVNAQDPSQYAGGDFAGLVSKKAFIQDMGYTIVSIGSIFDAEEYTGKIITSHTELEEHFGTEEELTKLISTYNESNMKIMVDFPLAEVSTKHEWLQDPANQNWVVKQQEQLVELDTKNPAVQQQLKEAVVDFVEKYKVGGIRFTALQQTEATFINELIAAVKAVNPNIYIITNEETTANVDAQYNEILDDAYRNMFKNVDLPSTDIVKYAADYLEGEGKPVQIMFDHLWANRFTVDSTNENMFPPTRIKMAMASSLLLPGVPVIQYGSELVMNGEAGVDAHQLYNFKTDKEIIEYVKDLQILRNDSSTLRSGEFTLLENDNGYVVFQRTSADESWLVVINNTSKTKRIDLTAENIGVDKELRGMFDSEIIKENKDGKYAVILDRELVEVYQVIEKRGLNISYLIALALVFITYTTFILLLMKRGKAKRALDVVKP